MTRAIRKRYLRNIFKLFHSPALNFVRFTHQADVKKCEDENDAEKRHAHSAGVAHFLLSPHAQVINVKHQRGCAKAPLRHHINFFKNLQGADGGDNRHQRYGGPEHGNFNMKERLTRFAAVNHCRFEQLVRD